MFYSNYEGKIFLTKDRKSKYDMALAYICIGGAYFLASLFLMVKRYIVALTVDFLLRMTSKVNCFQSYIVFSLAKGFTESIVDSGGSFYSYCNKVFGGWDYCIEDKKTADLKSKSVVKDLTVSFKDIYKMFPTKTYEKNRYLLSYS